MVGSRVVFGDNSNDFVGNLDESVGSLDVAGGMHLGYCLWEKIV